MKRLIRLSAVPVEGGYDLYVTTIEPTQAYGEKFAEFKTGGDYSPIKITNLYLIVDAILEIKEETEEKRQEQLARH